MKELKEKWLPIALVLFLGLLVVLGIGLYRETFVSWVTLGVAVIAIPVVFWPVTLLIFKRSGETKLGISLLHFIVLLPLTYYVILAVNYYTADKDPEIRTFPILKKAEMAGRTSRNRAQSVTILFGSLEKQLVFSSGEKSLIAASDRIEILFSKGCFGFGVMKQYTFK